MSNVRRLAILSASLLTTIALTASVPGPEDANWLRLRSMPRAERLRLADKLKTFDGLPFEDQEAIRGLDKAITADGPDNQVNNYAVLRRYHLWLGTLTESQRAELAKAPPRKRMAVVASLLSRQGAAQAPEPFLHRVADFGGVSPYELATLIKIWLKISPAQQAEVAALPDRQRAVRLHMIAREEKVVSVPRPSSEEIDILFQKVMRKNAAFPALKKAVQEKPQNKFKEHIAEYYSFIDHPLAPVKPEKLYEFDRALPVWLRSAVEDAPPREARWLLTNLYRLVFPAGTEMVARPALAASPGKPGGPAAKSGSSPVAPRPPIPAPQKNAGPPATPKSSNPF